MAQIDGLRYVEGGEEAHWHGGVPASPAFGRFYDHEEEHGHHNGKKSVLAKVKDVAKKLKHSLSKKRHGNDGGDDGHYTRDWGIILDENDDPAHPESPGATTYDQPILAPGTHKQAAIPQTATARRDQGTGRPDDGHARTSEPLDGFQVKNLRGQVEAPPQADVADKHVLEEAKNDSPGQPTARQGGSKTLTETVTEILSPAYAAVIGATRIITAKIQSPQMASEDREAMSKQMWDKGISVKEYLMQKLEPGEDEKALSDVITEAMSPRKRGASEGEVGMVEKVKDAVTSLLGKEKPADDQPAPGSEIPWGNTVPKEVRPVATYSKSHSLPVSTSPQVIQVPKSRPATSLPTTPHAPATSPLAQPNPLHKTPFEGMIAEEQQSHVKVLQAYLN